MFLWPNNELDYGWYVKLPSGLPHSEILTNNENDYSSQISAIYEKYIAETSEMQINIAYDSREEFLNNLQRLNGGDTLSEMELLKIFDKCLINIDENLKESYWRFRPIAGNYVANDDDDNADNVVSDVMQSNVS